MSLYSICKEIESLIDLETGEIADFNKFQELALARDEKIENTALFIKNLSAEALAIKAEENNLAERRATLENKAKRLTEYLNTFLNGDTYKSAKVALTYRKSVQTVVDNDFMEWAKLNGKEYLKVAEPTPDKTAIKKAISEGVGFKFAHLEEKQNLQIK